MGDENIRWLRKWGGDLGGRKALVAEMVGNLSQRLEPFGISVKELTGDISMSRSQIEATQVQTRPFDSTLNPAQPNRNPAQPDSQPALAVTPTLS